MSDTVTCRDCGFGNTPGDEFCGSCGTFLEWAAAPEGTAGSATGTDTSTAAEVAAAEVGATEVRAAEVRATELGPTDVPSAPVGTWTAVPPDLIRCDTCGTANQQTRAFCQSCGSRLPAVAPTARAGVRTRLAAGGAPPDRRLLIGAAAVLGLILLAGALVFSGVLSPSPTRPPSGTAIAASLVPGASASDGPPTSPSISAPVDATASPPPTASLPPPLTFPPGSQAPTNAPTRPSCEQRTLTAASTAVWQLGATRWMTNGRFDRIEIDLTVAQRRSDQPGSVIIEVVPIEEVSDRYGVDPPAEGEVAVVMSFPGQRLVGEIHGTTGLGGLRTVDIVRADDGSPIAVLGVNGRGCTLATAPGWEAKPAPDTAQLIVDIKR